MTYLTDQAGMVSGEQFTGTFVGMAAHDVSGHGRLPTLDILRTRKHPDVTGTRYRHWYSVGQGCDL